MAQLSPVRASVPTLQGLKLIHRGKVRDTYEIGEDLLLVVATDAISIFDFVLNALVPEKGYVLTAMSHFWFRRLESRGIKTHMVAVGREIDLYLPPHLRGNTDLQRRAMVVMRLDMALVEFIARNCLTGSVLGEYNKSGTVYGMRLKEGLRDGDELGMPLFTPTTKAEEGHDEPVDPESVCKKYPEETALFLSAFKKVSRIARRKRILLADGKGELGRDKDDAIRVGDEFGTPDSSRFWDLLVWVESRRDAGRKAPPPFDKQLVRAHGIERGVNTRDPKNPDDVAWVHALSIPQELIGVTTDTYRYIFWRLTGQTIENYAQHQLDVAIPQRKRKLSIVLGSESDIPAVAEMIRSVRTSRLQDGIEGNPSVNVISCHRNPVELDAFAASGCDGADVVIAAGGKALALPGVLDALLHSKGKKIPVIGVALGPQRSRSEWAARLSIEELPGRPVIIDEAKGSAYAGKTGFARALHRVAHGEMPPPKPRVSKPAELNIDLSL